MNTLRLGSSQTGLGRWRAPGVRKCGCGKTISFNKRICKDCADRKAAA